ncbi:aspartate aminotransferase family protein [Limnochorda pilosa]|uniref:Acetylornithine aminotransferase n=1 Tax=Limnochorda pilosa TaxID=1555112 RepID=A0A0K2SJ88_LIMPI|nr:aspartate aminotransferase family protein [Limnochorda pilosa]BAS27102.1 acetylornithine aminotransferase [Limnochorda pilosa]
MASEAPDRHLMPTYRRHLTLVRGQGSYVEDASGRRYLDWVAGIAVNALGHRHPRVLEALGRAAERFLHVSNLYLTEPQQELAGRLSRLTGLDRVFFANSGAEANEAAIKLARRYFAQQGKSGRVEILAVSHAFHGRTLATLAATDKPAYQQGFGPLPRGFHRIPRSDEPGALLALRRGIGPQTAAVMLEVVQGEAGVHPLDPEYLREVRRLCDRWGALLIVDEVQSGMGRTGPFAAYQRVGIQPDICTLAKALGGGLPLGATCAREAVAQAFQPGSHASTFGGNPVACELALAVLDLLESEGYLGEDGIVARLGAAFGRRLQELKAAGLPITAIRQVGLMIGADVAVPAEAVVRAAEGEGLLVNATGPHTLRLLPPYTTTQQELEEGFAKLEAALRAVAAEPPARDGAPPGAGPAAGPTEGSTPLKERTPRA